MTTLLKGIRKEDGASVEIEHVKSIFADQNLNMTITAPFAQANGDFNGDFDENGIGASHGSLCLPPVLVLEHALLLRETALSMSFKTITGVDGFMLNMTAEVLIFNGAGLVMAYFNKRVAQKNPKANIPFVMEGDFSDIVWTVPDGSFIDVDEDNVLTSSADVVYSILYRGIVDVD